MLGPIAPALAVFDVVGDHRRSGEIRRRRKGRSAVAVVDHSALLSWNRNESNHQRIAVDICVVVEQIDNDACVFLGCVVIINRVWRVVHSMDRDFDPSLVGAAIAVGYNVINRGHAVEVLVRCERQRAVVVDHNLALRAHRRDNCQRIAIWIRIVVKNGQNDRGVLVHLSHVIHSIRCVVGWGDFFENQIINCA